MAYSIEHKGNMVHDSSTSRSWAATLRGQDTAKASWVSAVSKPESTPYRHTKRASVSDISNTPKSTIIHESSEPICAPAAPVAVHATVPGRRDHYDELRPVDWVGGDDKFSWERTLRESTQPKPASRGGSVSEEPIPWQNNKGTRSAPVSMTHTREHSMVNPSGAPMGTVHSRRSSAATNHSRQASGAAAAAAAAAGGHSRRSSAAGGHSRRSSAGGHSRKPSMARHSRRSTKFDGDMDEDDVIEEEGAAEIEEANEGEVTNARDLPMGEDLNADAEVEPATETAAVAEEVSAPIAVRTAAPVEEGPQAVKETLAGSMLVEQAELIASMTVKQVVEQLATGTTVFKAWVRGTKQRGSTRHVKARVANDLVLLQYPSGFSKRQMTVIVSSIYVTVEPTKTVLTLETDNGTLVLKPYTPEHATLWAFGFNALLHLADKQGMMDENTVISDLPWHGIFQSPKEEGLELEEAGEAAVQEA